jgi:hypothetical protein
MKPLILAASLVAALAFKPLTPAQQEKTISYTGRVTEWRIDADGSVRVKLEMGSEARWFHTPPTQTTTTEFELEVLSAVLALTEPERGHPFLTVEGLRDTDRDPDAELAGSHAIVSISYVVPDHAPAGASSPR